MTEWQAFLERFGVTACVGLLAGTLGQCWAQNADVDVPELVAGSQLLLMMIVLGCVGVLSFRNTQPG